MLGGVGVGGVVGDGGDGIIGLVIWHVPGSILAIAVQVLLSP